MTAELDESVLEELYTWIDHIPLSRPKRDLKRDFSDGVLVAEVIKHFLPHFVELHNYCSALAVNKKLVNWHILNRKVFKKLNFEVNDDVIRNIVHCQPFAVESLLLLLHQKIEEALSRKVKCDKPEADQDAVKIVQDPSPRKAASIQPVTSSHKIAKASGSGSQQVMTSSSQKAVPPKEISGTFGKQVPGDAQTKLLLEEKDEQLRAKDETIEILHAKNHRLEQLLQLKEIRIEDLQTRLDEVKGQTRKAAGVVPSRKNSKTVKPEV